MDLKDLLNTPIDNLEHHGVKGMKWGVRRAGKAIGSSVTREAILVKNQVAHPVKYAKAAAREIKKNGYMQTGNNKDSKERLNKDVKSQIKKSKSAKADKKVKATLERVKNHTLKTKQKDVSKVGIVKENGKKVVMVEMKNGEKFRFD